MRSQDTLTRSGHPLHRAACAAAAMLATVFFQRTADAGLFTELRAASVDPAHAAAVVIQPDKKHVFLSDPAAVGATITMRLIAKVTGVDPDDRNDGLLSLSGAFLSNAVNGGAAHGNLSAARVVSIVGLHQTSGFNGSGGSNGAITDLNGDGDLDVGSNNDSDSTGFFVARATSAPDAVFGMAAPYEIVVATVNYTVRSVIGADFTPHTDINIRKRETFGGAVWCEDVHDNPDGGNEEFIRPYDPPFQVWDIGAPVTIVAPEPAALGLLALPLLLIRRRG
jgi:hypothetical protein